MRESAALVGAFLLACALGGGAPDDGPALESYRRARATLDTGVQAIGGLDALAALTTVVREMTGVRTDSGQGLVPTDTSHNRPSIIGAVFNRDTLRPKFAAEQFDFLTKLG